MREYIDLLNELRGIDAIRKPDEPLPEKPWVDSSTRKRAQTKTLASVLLSYGFYEVSSGSYSLVYEHPGLNYVVKLFIDDACYRRFVDIVRSNQDNRHFPRIFGKGYLKLPGDKLFGIRIEKLQPIDKFVVASFDNIIYGIDRYLRKGFTHQRAVIAKVYGEDFFTALDLLRAGVGNCFFDLHEYNLMQRQDGTAVIIDPFQP